TIVVLGRKHTVTSLLLLIWNLIIAYMFLRLAITAAKLPPNPSVYISFKFLVFASVGLAPLQVVPFLLLGISNRISVTCSLSFAILFSTIGVGLFRLAPWARGLSLIATGCGIIVLVILLRYTPRMRLDDRSLISKMNIATLSGFILLNFIYGTYLFL